MAIDPGPYDCRSRDRLHTRGCSPNVILLLATRLEGASSIPSLRNGLHESRSSRSRIVWWLRVDQVRLPRQIGTAHLPAVSGAVFDDFFIWHKNPNNGIFTISRCAHEINRSFTCEIEPDIEFGQVAHIHETPNCYHKRQFPIHHAALQTYQILKSRQSPETDFYRRQHGTTSSFAQAAHPACEQ